jgi:hypothetical protein
MKNWTCTDCKLTLPPTTNYWYQNQLDRVNKNPNRISIGGKCKSCATEYGRKWRAAIKAKGLTRSQKNFISSNKSGTIYVIGTEEPGNPYKIGKTMGTDTRARKSDLQVSHWLPLKEFWKSDYIPNIDQIEIKLHKHFDNVRIRGEWFKISHDDIKMIPSLIENFNKDLI